MDCVQFGNIDWWCSVWKYWLMELCFLFFFVVGNIDWLSNIPNVIYVHFGNIDWLSNIWYCNSCSFWTLIDGQTFPIINYVLFGISHQVCKQNTFVNRTLEFASTLAHRSSADLFWYKYCFNERLLTIQILYWLREYWHIPKDVIPFHNPIAFHP